MIMKMGNLTKTKKVNYEALIQILKSRIVSDSWMGVWFGTHAAVGSWWFWIVGVGVGRQGQDIKMNDPRKRNI